VKSCWLASNFSNDGGKTLVLKPPMPSAGEDVSGTGVGLEGVAVDNATTWPGAKPPTKTGIVLTSLM
jgi:hypothetical protein